MGKKILLTLLVLIVNLPVISYSKTASELITTTRLLGRDPSASGRVRFSDTQILGFLNEAQRDAIADTLCIRREYSFDTVANTTYYAMPSDFIAVDRLLSDNQRLEEKSPAKLDAQSTEWDTTTGEPTNFFINFASRTKVGMYPFPGTVTDTTTIKVEYYAQTTDMTTSNTPFNAISEFTPFHDMLAYYSAAQMLYIDGFINQADRYMQRYLAWREAFKGYCKVRPGYNPSINVLPAK